MKQEVLEKYRYYHIYNRGINGCEIFKTDENKRYFLKLVDKHLSDKISILAFCLMGNHYHIAMQVITDEKIASKALSNLFNAYAKAFNKKFNRTGTLFERPFKRKRIESEDYLRNLILYIHRNPENHGVVSDFTKFPFSSYGNICESPNEESSLLAKKEAIALFDDLVNFKLLHLQGKEEHLSNFRKLDLSGFENLTGLPVDSTIDSEVKDKFYTYIQTLQDTITSKLEEVDGTAKFREDIWERPEGGGGRSRVIENGAVFEKGGVNISAVHGELPNSMQAYFGVEDADFFACGLSLVLHPKNPMVPTVHANWRYFEMYDKKGGVMSQWFGGGQDLTPYYLFDEDAVHFHSVCKRACDTHNRDFYPSYKKKCDDYFWNAHRNEARGVGGLFFDYCKATDDMSMLDWFNFVTEVGNSFLEAYVPIVEKRKNLPYTQKQRNWQEIRRGRYVEFNLVHDKGTLFGLKTNGRIESILMSLPPHVQWRYDHHPEEGSGEARLVVVLQNPREWT